MSNAAAFVYDAKRTARGAAGIMTRPDEAVFSPWLTGLGYPQPFVVQVVSDTGATEWLSPASVEYVRLDGAAESSNLAIVTFATGTALPVEVPPGIPEEAVVDALSATDCRRAVATLFPPVFAELGKRKAPPAGRTLAATDAMAMPTPTVPSSFQVVTGPPALAQKSICRIFRWD